MSEKKGPGGFDASFSKDDVNLWKAMTKDIQKLDETYTYADPISEPPPPGADMPEPVFDHPVTDPDRTDILLQGRDVDKRTAEKLRKGKFAIEGRLDLHGYTQDEAQRAIEDFVLRAYQSQKRCVLIITGKGNGKKQNEDTDWTVPAPGVLRRRLPDWLNGPVTSLYVLQFVPAQPKDGGDGAFYVYLRRNRA